MNKLIDWIEFKVLRGISKLSNKEKLEFGDKFKTKILKKLDREYKNIIYFEELLSQLYGIDSQIYLDFKDKLNALSMDPDRD